MRPRHRVSRTAIELVKRFEGYRRQAAQLPDGRWTIGHGHTLTARQGAEVSEDDAEALLVYDLIAVTHEINERVFTPLTQNQFDALCSFAFNLGLDSFRGSQVLKRLNEGQTVQAACAMELWRKAEFAGERIVVDALVRRRAAEKLLFLTPPGDAWVPAPSPVLRPLLDSAAGDIVPGRPPAQVSASMDGETVTLAEAAEPEPLPPPIEDEAAGEAVRAAAEAVAARLQSIFPEPEEAPTAAPEEARPQADFAPPITPAPQPEEPPEASADGFEVPPHPPSPPKAADDDAPRTVIDDVGAYEFIPTRVQPLPRKREGSVVLDIVLGLLGLTFFSFGLAWGASARPNLAGGLVSPLVVGLLAGAAGVGFFVVAVFRLLQRLGRAAERD